MSNKITDTTSRGSWAIVLGGSRGLGLASAQKLARHGYNLFLVHRDRKADLPSITKNFDAIRKSGVACITYNTDALKQVSRNEVLDLMQNRLGDNDKINVLVHSIAKGNLKPINGPGASLSHEDFILTLDAMAVSWYDWTLELLQRGMLADDTRVMAFTSEGNAKVIANYAAVAAAKSALESICRYMAVALAPVGIKVNCIQAGVTDTYSLGMIPGSDQIRSMALKRNPSGRLTTPQDIANVVYLMCREEAEWITGTVIKADGGESLR